MKRIKIWIIIFFILIILIPLIYLILQVNQISKSTLSSEVGSIIQKPITDFTFYKVVRNTDNKLMNLENTVSLNELFNKIEKKKVRRIPGKDGSQVSHEAIYSLEYDGGKEGFIIDKNGRILVTRDKGDIRNISRLHWMWWKIDGITDNYTGIYYITEPDNNILDYVEKKIFEKG